MSKNNPFPGLRHFEQKETHLFFGRDGQSKELLRRLQESRFLTLVGVSGSGKSSLVRAGLLPALFGGLMSSVESDWRVAVFRPGNSPIGHMARALITQAGFGSGDSNLQDVESAVAETTLRRGNLGLLELVKRAKTKKHEDGRPFLGENENVLLVVDQFEEIFRIIEQYDELVRVKQLSDGTSDLAGTTVDDGLDCHPREEASAFVKLLLESTRKKQGKYDENLYIIVTMRSDYLGETAQFWGMAERINEGQYLIPRMNRDDRRKAIVGPIAVAGGSIAEPLVNQLLNDAGENPGHLPILQHALMRMWEVAANAPQNGGLKLEHYDQIGRLSGALSQHANEAYDDLSPQLQTVAAKVFKCLTEKGLANRETRRPMTIAEIASVIGASEENVKAVVECFRSEYRWFLMPPPPVKLKSDTLVDISHESLISGWNRLSKWVNEEAESARTYKRLADTAILKERGAEDYYRGPALQLALKWRDENAPNAAWARRYHPEFDKAIAFLNDSLKDNRKRRLRNYSIVLAILLIVSGAVAFGVLTQQRMLRQQSDRIVAEAALTATAIDERKKAEKREAEAKDLRDKAEKLQVADQAKAVQLEALLLKQKELVTEANHARSAALEQRDIALNLQKENHEQANTYRLFKTAFDYVASRDYDKALTSLQSAMRYFAEKEKSATADSEKKESRRNWISTRVNIADVHRSKSTPETDVLALQDYDYAIQLLGSGDDELLASTLMKAGRVWKDSKKQDQALQAVAYYEMAAPVFDRIGNRVDSSRAHVNAGKLHLSFNDLTGFQKAAAHFTTVVMLLQGNNTELAATSAEIGEAYTTVVTSESEAEEEDGEVTPKGNSRGRDAKVEERLRENGAKYFGIAANALRLSLPRAAADIEVKRGEILSATTSENNVHAAAEAFSSAAMLYGQAGDMSEQVSVLIQGGASLLENDSATAQALAERLLEQAADVDQKDSAKQTETLSDIALIYANLDPPQTGWALEYYRRAIVFARRNNNKTAEVNAILAKARGVETLDGENKQTELNELYDQVLRVYSDDVAKQLETVVRFGRTVMGTSRTATERISKAGQFYEKALAVARAQPDKKLVGSTHLSIGVAYSLLRHDEAPENYKLALKIYEAERDPYGQAMALYRLGVFGGREASQFTDRSLGIFEKLLPSLEKSGKPLEIAEAHFAMGSLYRRRRNFKEALSSYTKALAIFETLPDQATRVKTLKSTIRTTQRQLE